MVECGWNSYRKRKMRGCDTLSPRGYNLAIGGVLLWGFLINLLMCKFLTPVFMEWDFTAILIGYFVVALVGIIISKVSRNPFVSFIGYNMVVVPVGVVLSIALADVDSFSVMSAVRITVIFSIAMIVISSLYPNFFLSLGRVLFTCLIIVVVAEGIMLLFGKIMPTIWDTIVATLFCLYIGYDWVEAQEIPHSLDNAVDTGVGLYLDIINLFLRIISIKSSKDD